MKGHKAVSMKNNLLANNRNDSSPNTNNTTWNNYNYNNSTKNSPSDIPVPKNATITTLWNDNVDNRSPLHSTPWKPLCPLYRTLKNPFITTLRFKRWKHLGVLSSIGRVITFAPCKQTIQATDIKSQPW